MLGFLIGTACLIGFIATARRARYACGYGGGWGHGGHCGGGSRRHGGWHPRHHAGYDGCERGGHHGPYRDEWEGGRGFRGGFRGSFGFGPRAWLSMISERLELTPAQEKAFRQSFEEVRDAMRRGRGELRDTRKDVAKAIRAGSFDAVLLGETFSRHDSAMDEVRKAIVGALARIHESLDEQQRERLAQLIEDGPWGWR